MRPRARKHNLLATAAFPGLLLGSVWIWYGTEWQITESRISGVSFARVCIGMSKAEVEDILGPPVGGYDKRYKAEGGGENQPISVEHSGAWVGPDYHGCIRFDAAGFVRDWDGSAWYAPPQPLWMCMREWVGL